MTEMKEPAKEPIAHVAEDGRTHPLYEHLQGIADLAGKFAAEFGCGKWGRLAGLWHDELIVVKEVNSHENL